LGFRACIEARSIDVNVESRSPRAHVRRSRAHTRSGRCRPAEPGVEIHRLGWATLGARGQRDCYDERYCPNS
jgi:hypothetical protein